MKLLFPAFSAKIVDFRGEAAETRGKFTSAPKMSEGGEDQNQRERVHSSRTFYFVVGRGGMGHTPLAPNHVRWFGKIALECDETRGG